LVRARARSATAAAAVLGAALVGLVFSAREQPRLAAAAGPWRADSDGDGLADDQELVLGTSPDLADSDGDGYSDLEERARNSDPLDPTSVPGSAAVDVGTCASCVAGYVSMVSAVYSDSADLDSIRLEVGVVYQGRIFRFSPRSFRNSRASIYQGRDAHANIAVVEVGIPAALVRRLGQVSLFSVVRGSGPNPITPRASVLPLVDFSGVIVAVEEHNATFATANNDHPTGVVYRPLASEDEIPSTWNGGEICFQHTSPVGRNGISLVQEVDSATCQPMDTFCSPMDCSAGVGKALELPDPAALIGG
jgi:hypothetical protein